MVAIDIHTHGIAGYDTRTSDEGHILKMAEIQGSYGVSAVMPTVYPALMPQMRQNMAAIKGSQTPARTGTMSPASIIGIHLEGPFLNPARCGALDKSAFIEPTEYNLSLLMEGFEDIVRIITVSPEINGALKLIKKISDMGILVSMGHSDATYEEAEAGFMKGARGITHIFNAMRGIHHREAGISGFGLLNQDIYIEVIADPFHLHPKTLELIFRTKNPERIIIVSDSVKESQTPSLDFNKGVVNSSGRLIGGSMTITESSKRLIEMGFDEDVINRCIGENPERYLSMQ